MSNWSLYFILFNKPLEKEKLSQEMLEIYQNEKSSSKYILFIFNFDDDGFLSSGAFFTLVRKQKLILCLKTIYVIL